MSRPSKAVHDLYEHDHSRYFDALRRRGKHPHEMELVYAGWRAWYDGYKAAQRMSTRKTGR